MHNKVTLYSRYLMYFFILYVSCTVVVLTCIVMCVRVYVGVFGDMCTCIYCVLYFWYCFFVMFRLCVFILICFVCTSVRSTATG
jgi:hypothetical protein